MTSHFVCGQVPFPLDLLVYRRYEEQTRWSEFDKNHFPDRQIPKTKKARQQFHKEVAPLLLLVEECRAKELHDQFQTKIALAMTYYSSKAVDHELPFKVVLFVRWLFCTNFLQTIERLEKDWDEYPQKNRNIEEINSVDLKDQEGKGQFLYWDSTSKLKELDPPDSRQLAIGKSRSKIEYILVLFAQHVYVPRALGRCVSLFLLITHNAKAIVSYWSRIVWTGVLSSLFKPPCVVGR